MCSDRLHLTLLLHIQPQVLAKYISDYNIKAIKFSPYEEGRLMTCGKDSIRMFRLKVCLIGMRQLPSLCVFALLQLQF